MPCLVVPIDGIQAVKTSLLTEHSISLLNKSYRLIILKLASLTVVLIVEWNDRPCLVNGEKSYPRLTEKASSYP